MSPLRPNVREVDAEGSPRICAHDFIGHRVVCEQGWDFLREVIRLSPRELDIVRRVFDDKNEAQIACELKLSPHTVHTYLARIYRKADVASRVQLVIRLIALVLEACPNACVMRPIANGDSAAPELSSRSQSS